MRDLITHVGTDYAAFAITGVLALIVTLVYLWWNERSAGKLSCPGLTSEDEELGNLGSLTKDGGLHQFLNDNHKKFGPIFSFYWGKELAVSLGSPALWKDIQTLFDRPVHQFELFKPLIGESSIQYLNGPLGRKHRQIHDRHFSFSAIKSYFHVFNEASEELMKKLSTLNTDEHIQLRQYLFVVAMKSLVRTSFGNEYFKSNKECIELSTAYDTCWEDMESRLDGDMPEPGSERQKAFDDALTVIKDKAMKVIEQRRTLKEKTTYNLLDVMLEKEELYPHDEQLVDMVITYLIGGFHTTGNLLTWTFYFLCRHPEVEEKLLAELKEVLGDETISMSHMDKLTYTRQIIDETLRCSVLAPYAARYSEYDIVVGGHIIPKLTPLIISLGTVLEDENIWPEPKKFDPDRFSPEKLKERPNMAFEPFGFAGKRKCPGYRFAYFDTTVFLVDIIRKFKVKLVEGQNITMQHRLVTQPKEAVWFKMEPRN
ncbi:cytochrome P450 20A1-like [Hydractinia symbiolongicarpus]|uniref:cytochrome P450 20A1-like n=1 Tax=Hydractinia symbiolongicarpus TaxID=13093 RepID=UPI002550206D|nr:cytochrome P450 20A1-like [Hydractinia symbiolongicarpus]